MEVGTSAARNGLQNWNRRSRINMCEKDRNWNNGKKIAFCGLGAALALSVTACGNKDYGHHEKGVANPDTSQTEFAIMGGRVR